MKSFLNKTNSCHDIHIQGTRNVSFIDSDLLYRGVLETGLTVPTYCNRVVDGERNF